ncbi:MAG: hypothetical protein HYX32_08980 [Actinobacteria bacterium]|nr:hypothetical protein [Actinomycetota bacterium]
MRRGLVATGAIAIVVLVLAELAARALSPFLPEPKLWADDATTVKVAQLEARAGTCTDLIVAGNSMGRDAFVPAVFSAADPARRTAWNASLDAASPPLLRRWLTEVVVPRARPATVVLTLASLDVNANSKAARSVRDSYDSAPLSRPGLWGKVEATVVGSSALLQRRTELRQPSLLWDALGRARSGQRPATLDASGLPGVLGADGEGLSRRPLRYTGSPASKAFLTGQLLNDYQLDAGLLTAEADLVRALQGAGVSVVLLVLPVTDDYAALHPGGKEQFDAFLALARSTATATGVPFIDLARGTAADRFADTNHLNAAGADAFSRDLPGLLAASGVEPRRCG